MFSEKKHSNFDQLSVHANANVNANVFMYADQITEQMQAAIDETERRRTRQVAYNTEHGITAKSIRKAIRTGMERELAGHRTARAAFDPQAAAAAEAPTVDREELVAELENEMLDAAARLEFERAAQLRDQIAELKAMPKYGDAETVSRPPDKPRKRPGEARSRAGQTKRSKRRR